MIQRARHPQKIHLPVFLLVLAVFLTLLSGCGVIDEGRVRQDTEGIIEDEWNPKNPKQTFDDWWKGIKTGQDENVETGLEKFLNWLPDPIAKLFGWKAETTAYITATPEEFANMDQVLANYQFQVPQEVYQYFEQAESLPLEEVRLRLEIIARAEAYPRDISYNPAESDAYGFRKDGAGFVSYIWQLEKSSDAASMIAYSGKTTIEDLKPGDILNNLRYAAAGHIVLFAHWVDVDTKTFKGYHMNPTANGVSFNHFELIPDPKVDSAWTIKGIDMEGPFYPYRWEGFIIRD